jgi:hypothetical protein
VRHGFEQLLWTMVEETMVIDSLAAILWKKTMRFTGR